EPCPISLVPSPTHLPCMNDKLSHRDRSGCCARGAAQQSSARATTHNSFRCPLIAPPQVCSRGPQIAGLNCALPEMFARSNGCKYIIACYSDVYAHES